MRFGLFVLIFLHWGCGSPVVRKQKIEAVQLSQSEIQPVAELKSEKPVVDGKKDEIKNFTPQEFLSQNEIESEKNFQSSNTKDSEKDFERAAKLSLEGRENEALVSFMDFQRRHPKDKNLGQVYLRVGDIYFNRKAYDQAEAEYRKVFTSPSTKDNWKSESGLKIGKCLIKKKRIKEAYVEWEAILRKYPHTEHAKEARLLLMEKETGVQ